MDIDFKNPYPENGATNVNLKITRVYFNSVCSPSGYPVDFESKEPLFDSVNPPSKPFELQVLHPNKKYYWRYIIENVSGEVCSTTQSFTTACFDGNWKLDTLTFFQEKYPNSLLLPNNELSEILILGNSAQLKFYENPEETIITTFSYNSSNTKTYFVNNQNDTIRSYYLQNVGYLAEFTKTVLVLHGKFGQLLYIK